MWPLAPVGHLVVVHLVELDHLAEAHLLEALNFLMRSVVAPIDCQVPLSAGSVLVVLMAVHMGFA